MNDNLFTEPDQGEPADPSSDALRRLILALQPGDDAQRGLLVATVTLLGGDTSDLDKSGRPQAGRTAATRPCCGPPSCRLRVRLINA